MIEYSSDHQLVSNSTEQTTADIGLVQVKVIVRIVFAACNKSRVNGEIELLAYIILHYRSINQFEPFGISLKQPWFGWYLIFKASALNK